MHSANLSEIYTISGAAGRCPGCLSLNTQRSRRGTREILWCRNCGATTLRDADDMESPHLMSDSRLYVSLAMILGGLGIAVYLILTVADVLSR